jgi:hypothetical protein
MRVTTRNEQTNFLAQLRSAVQSHPSETRLPSG